MKREELEVCMMSESNRRCGWGGEGMWRTGGSYQQGGIRLKDFRGERQCPGCEGDNYSILQTVNSLYPLSLFIPFLRQNPSSVVLP